MIPHLLNLLRPESSDRFGPRRDPLDRSVATAALAALATDQDHEIISALEQYAFGPRGLSLTCLALLRIGGTCVDDVLRQVEDGGISAESVHLVLRNLWTLRSLPDLERAALAVERMSRTHSDAALRSSAEWLGLRPMRAAIQVRTRPQDPETYELLRRIVRYQERAFVAIHGSDHWYWALLQMANLRAPSAAEDVRSILRIGAPGKRCEVLVFLVFLLQKLGEPLTAEEEQWVAQHRDRCRFPMPRLPCLEAERQELREFMGRTHAVREAHCDCVRPWGR